MTLSIDKNICIEHQTFVFDKDESRHLVKVLRKKEGDTVFITNGKGDLFQGEITLANEKKCTVQIINHQHYKKNRDFCLHIAIAPTKLNDRYEWFLEKAVEIGIDEITPIICDHSERKIVKIERYNKIIQSAMKQSLQYHLPVLNNAIPLKQFLRENEATQKFIAHCENETEKVFLQNSVQPKGKITVLIGPEGDFSTQEITKAKELDYLAVSLGKNRLRTETAGVYVASLMTVM